ncbi:MAG: filamentous hemagglutinin N-terminal domain-containing protein [Candidatus Pacebacteria bacterium]|nr:filamentous hemagglutinin N-terminal domain-containing protein [Candidatus Paceibacterota bacterium]
MNNFKSSSIFQTQVKNSTIGQILLAGASTALLLMAALRPAAALPQGGTVVDGAATYATEGSKTTITQTSDRAAIDWTSFNLESNESAEFKLPSAASATLNRITGPGITTIKGTVTSNGSVFFVNPNGLIFDVGSRVTANGFVASVNDITNGNFMSGMNTTGSARNQQLFKGLYFNTTHAGLNATVSLKGDIAVNDFGLVAAIGPNVENSGTISATFGTVGLVSGSSVRIGLSQNLFYDDRLAVTPISTNSQLFSGTAIRSVKNSGTITAAGGDIYLTAGYANTSHHDSSITIVNSGSLLADGKNFEKTYSITTKLRNGTIFTREAVNKTYRNARINIAGSTNSQISLTETSLIKATGGRGEVSIGTNNPFGTAFGNNNSIVIKNGSVIGVSGGFGGGSISLATDRLTLDGILNGRYIEIGALNWNLDFTKLQYTGSLGLSVQNLAFSTSDERSFTDRIVFDGTGSSSLSFGDVKFLLGKGDLALNSTNNSNRTLLIANGATSQLSWDSGRSLQIFAGDMNIVVTGGNYGINSNGAYLALSTVGSIDLYAKIQVGEGGLSLEAGRYSGVNNRATVNNHGYLLQAKNLYLTNYRGNSYITNAMVDNLQFSHYNGDFTFVNHKSLYLNGNANGKTVISTVGGSSFDITIMNDFYFTGNTEIRSSGRINVAPSGVYGTTIIGTGSLSLLAAGDIDVFGNINIGDPYSAQTNNRLKIVSDLGSVSFRTTQVHYYQFGDTEQIWQTPLLILVKGDIEIIANNITSEALTDINATGNISIIGQCGGSETALCDTAGGKIDLRGRLSTSSQYSYSQDNSYNPNYWYYSHYLNSWTDSNSQTPRNGKITIANHNGSAIFSNLVSSAGVLSIYSSGSIAQLGGRIESYGKGITITSTSTDEEKTIGLKDVANISLEDGSDQPLIVVNSAKGISLSGNAVRLVTLPKALVELNSATNLIEVIAPKVEPSAVALNLTEIVDVVPTVSDSPTEVPLASNPPAEEPAAPVSVFSSGPAAQASLGVTISPVALVQ